MFVGLLTGAANGKQNVSLLVKTTSFSFPSSSPWRRALPPCSLFVFCKVNPGWQLTNDLKMATSSVLQLFFSFFIGGRIRWMPWIFAMYLFQARFYAWRFYPFGKGFVWAGSRTDLAWKKVVISCSQAWDCHQIFAIWTYPVLASWHGEGIQYYRQAGHQMGVWFISVFPLHIPLPSHQHLIQVMSLFFSSAGQFQQYAENLMSLRTEQLFVLIIWLIFFPSLLFSWLFFPSTIIICIHGERGRRKKGQKLQQLWPLWQKQGVRF